MNTMWQTYSPAQDYIGWVNSLVQAGHVLLVLHVNGHFFFCLIVGNRIRSPHLVGTKWKRKVRYLVCIIKITLYQQQKQPVTNPGPKVKSNE